MCRSWFVQHCIFRLKVHHLQVLHAQAVDVLAFQACLDFGAPERPRSRTGGNPPGLAKRGVPARQEAAAVGATARRTREKAATDPALSELCVRSHWRFNVDRWPGLNRNGTADRRMDWLSRGNRGNGHPQGPSALEPK